MKHISILTIKKLYAMSGNVCAMPSCNTKLFTESEDFLGQICHINARSKNGPRYDQNQSDEERNSYDNLLILCPNCHVIIDGREDLYPAEALKEIKRIHEKYYGRMERDEDLFKAQRILNTSTSLHVEHSNNVAINSPGTTQTTVLQFRTTKKTPPPINPPADSIASNRLLHSYIKHLIDRYNDFASKDKNRKSKFHYSVIYRNIQQKFGTKWDLLNVNDVPALATYLHAKIDRTLLGRLNGSKGRKNYSSLDEWTRSHPNLL